MRKIIVLVIISLTIILLKNKNTKKSEQVSLFGINLVIDPGHGGKDNGTCFNEVLEDEINLAIATKLMNLCIEDGAMSALTRVNDYDLASLYSKNRKNEDLKKRVEFINNSGAQIFISIHINSYPTNPSVYGPMVYYKKNNAQSQKLAQDLANELNEFCKTDKPIHFDDFYLFRKTEIPGVLVECGFLSNSQDRKKLCEDTYQMKFATALYRGIHNYLQGVII